jgi:hypothetical protein
MGKERTINNNYNYKNTIKLQLYKERDHLHAFFPCATS